MRMFFDFRPVPLTSLGRIALVVGAVFLLFTIAATPQITAGGKKNTKIVNQQRTKAWATWRRGMRDNKEPGFGETDHFFICGNLAEDKIKALGVQLEKVYKAAVDAMQLKDKEMWTGKLTVFLVPEERDYKFFIIRVEVRKVTADERGSVALREGYPHVVVGPQRDAADLALGERAGEQVARAVLLQKHPKFLPEWLHQGFGRASVIKTWPYKRRLAEYRQAQLLAARKNRRVQDAWSANIPTDEAAVLRGNVVYYLAYSGKLTKRFHGFLKGFRPTGNRPQSPEAAFKTTGATIEDFNRAWRRSWLRLAK